MRFSTHYSHAQESLTLFKWAKKTAAKIFTLAEKGNFHPVFAYAGMSGISHATALSIVLKMDYPKFKFGMIYVRKAREISHGSIIEHNIPDSKRELVLVFVDDFISSGSTFRRVLKKINDEYSSSIKFFHNNQVLYLTANRNCGATEKLLNNSFMKLYPNRNY